MAVGTPLATEYLARVKKGEFPHGLPTDVIAELAQEVGANWVYLTVPELMPIILEAAAQAWEGGKLQARVQNTAWWKNTNQQAQMWPQASQAEQEKAIQTWTFRLAEQYRDLYGPDYQGKNNLGSNSTAVRHEAYLISSGQKLSDQLFFQHRARAEKIEGTPAWAALQEERRKAGAPKSTIENTQRELLEGWREWMGDHVKPPSNLKKWATNIYNNKQSMADWETNLEKTSSSMYTNKPIPMSYKQWVTQPKQMLAGLLELGVVRDNDPLLTSYIRGEIPSMADLQDRARRDRRFAQTNHVREEVREMALNLQRRWGFI